MSIVGFDFGTTNSLLSTVQGGRAISFLDDEQRPTPSVVCYEGTKTIVGRAARERMAQAGLGVQGNIVRSPKMFLGRDGVFVDGTERSPVDIVADVVRHVVDSAKKGRRGRDIQDMSGAVVTIPVDMEGYRRRALRDAFRLAGVNIVQFVHEPLAALYGLFRSADAEVMLRRYDKKLILVFDWGGGTLDLTLCRPLNQMVVQLMNDGTDEVGGDVFDETIANALVKRVCASRGLVEMPEMQTGAKARLFDRCERAKIDLSTRPRVEVYVGSYFRGTQEEDFEYSLTQEDLDGIVSPLLDKGFRRVNRLLESSGYLPEQVALCVATGGMSNMPIVKRRLHEWFGPERVQIPDGTATLIAEGAAWIASDKAGLQLAKNVELLLARQSYLPLVKAGTVMPREGEVQHQTFHLYCTDPRDGIAKFEICAPVRAGGIVLPNDTRTHLQNLTIKVDSKAPPFRERLELDVRITDDLILEAHARSLNVKDQDRVEVHNLEFGLAFPSAGGGSGSRDDGPQSEHRHNRGESSRGALSSRANVASREDLRLVPGEYLYQLRPHYFDSRDNPPKEQVHERLYYEPCLACGRVSNDPLCRCSDGLQNARRSANSPGRIVRPRSPGTE